MNTLPVLAGERVREFRDREGLSQGTLADAVTRRCGVEMSRATVVRVEQGRRDLTVAELAAIAFVLNAPPAAFVTPIDRGRERLALLPKALTMNVSAAYFWWVGIEPPVSPRGRRMNKAHGINDEQAGYYDTAVRVHVTQGWYADARNGMARLDRLAAAAADPDVNYDRAPTDVEFERHRERARTMAREFVRALQAAQVAGLPRYPVPVEWWPDLAAAVGRDDPHAWADDVGIEPYEPEATP